MKPIKHIIEDNAYAVLFIEVTEETLYFEHEYQAHEYAQEHNIEEYFVFSESNN